MQITRVELKNIKNHADAEWDFLPGLIAICGPNGSGKTTIIEAIAWALFDLLDYKREDFVKRGQTKGQVSVSFISDLDEREYTVQRDTSGGYLASDAVTRARLAEQRNQVLPWLCQHIGVEPGTDLASLFRTTIGVPQGTFTHDFTLRPAERKRVFDHTLKVDEYRDASDRLRLTVRHIEAETTTVELAIATAEGELKAYEQTRHDLASARTREGELRSASELASSEQARLILEMSGLDELRRLTELHHTTSERLEVKLRLTRDKLTSAREAADQSRVAFALVEASRAGYEAYLRAAGQLNDLDERRASRDKLQAELRSVERTQIEIAARIDHYRRRLDEGQTARLELSGLTRGIEEQTQLEARIASLREGRGARQGLQKQLERLDEELQRLRKRYAELAKDLDQANAQRAMAESLPALESERMQLEGAISREEFGLQALKVKRENIERLGRELARLRMDRDLAQRDLTELGKLTSTASRLELVGASHREQTSRLAQLRAEVERDNAMVISLESGGMCPLLTEKCLNLGPGESLDSRFREGLSQRKGEIDRLEGSSTQLAVDLNLAQQAAAHLARLPQLQVDLKRLDEAIAVQLKQIEIAEEEVSSASREFAVELASARERRSRLDQELTAARAAQHLYQRADFLRVEVDSIRERGKLQRDEREELAARLRDTLDVAGGLNEAEASLRALGNPRGRAEAIEHQLKQADEWKATVEGAEREANSIAADFAKVSAALGAYANLEADLAQARGMRAANEAAYKDLIANEQAASTLERREQEAQQTSLEVTETEDALNAAIAEYTRLNASYDRHLHSRTHTDLDDCRRRVTQVATQMEHFTQEVARLESQFQQLEEVRQQLHSHLAERDKLRRLGETAEFIRATLLQAAPYITEAYLFSISHEANQLYREIAGRHDVTLRWTREYEITLEEDGQDRPFGNLSGGEQMAAALAIRLALLKELSEINLAFFDEPTANLDEDRRHNLAQQIGRIKHFKQLFVVSHDDSFEAYTDQVIMLSEKQIADAPSGLS